MSRLGSLGLALCLGSAAAATAGEIRDPLRPSRPTVSVPRIPRAPALEEFLDMAPPPDLAGVMRPISGFVQREPEDGRAASQKTDVYLGYDDHSLYIVFVAWDEEPHKIRAHFSRREQVFSDETVEIQLDTFDDEQRAFTFLTNPFGIQWDAIWTEGQGFDMAWDTVWHSRGQLTDRGYVVLMAIPFKSLRFRPKPEETHHSWGMILVRDIPRNNETSFWPHVSNRIEGRLNQAGTAEGFRGVAPGRNLWIIPYLAAGRQDARTAPDRPTTKFEEANVGLDVKWVIRDSFTLDLTANPNFAQVESDEPQVTVNQRFPVFFPERRPFFLENADYFNTPINLLFTRRIVDPDGGARLTGQAGKYRIGAFLINDAFPGKVAPPGSVLDGQDAVNGIFRIRRDLPNQSNVGFMVTDRELGDSYNRVASFDTRIKFGQNWDTRLQAASSTTRLSAEGTNTSEQLRFQDPSYSLAFNRAGRKFNTHIHYRDIGREFRSWLGFIPRTDIRDSHAQFRYSLWPERKKLIRWEPRLFVQRIANHDGTRLDQTVSPGIEFEFRRRTSFGVSGRIGRERLLRCQDYFDGTCFPDQVPPPDGEPLPADADFEIDEIGFDFRTQFVSAIDFSLGYTQGRTVNFFPLEGQLPTPADGRSLRSDLTLRLGRHLRIGGRYLYTDLVDRVSGGAVLTDQITRARFDWQFDPILSLRVILEHDRTRSDALLTTTPRRNDLNADFLLTYLVNPWTAFYVGFNTNRTQTALDDQGDPEFLGSPFDNSRLAFVKISYLFQP